MKQIRFTVQLISDYTGDKDPDDYALELVDLVNETLQSANLDTQPQIGSPGDAEIEGNDEEEA